MTWTHALLLVLAGVGAGLAGSMAGLASLVSFPALLAVGLPPVAANVTNTVALVGSSLGAAAGSRPELVGQWRRISRLAPAVAVGGLAGAGLLLLGPATAFEAVVPYLVAASALLLLAQEWAGRVAARRAARTDGESRRHGGTQEGGCGAQGEGRGAQEEGRGTPEGAGTAATLGLGAVSVYSGYFGAGSGVVVLAVLGAVFPGDTPHRLNATKNVLLGVANGVAAVVFAVSGPVVWLAALPLALGFLAGGRAGPVLLRRVPRHLLRVAIGIAGLGLAVQLWLQANR